MLPRLLRHCYCYADSRFSNPMVSGLAAYAMKRCSMKRKSIACDTQSLLGCGKTSVRDRSSRSGDDSDHIKDGDVVKGACYFPSRCLTSIYW